MMNMNRTKSTMLMAAIAAAMTFSAMGCTDEAPKTPAEQLLQAAQDGNKRIDTLLKNHEVLTTQIVSETLSPIDKAGEVFNAELISWQDAPADAAYLEHELATYQKASVEIANLTAKLDAEGFALGAVGSGGSGSGSAGCTGEDCGCDTVVADPDIATPERQAGTEDPAGIAGLTEKVYWKRLACRAACGAAQALCSAACGPIVVGGVTVPLAVACVAACGVAGGLCQEACAQSYPNCR